MWHELNHEECGLWNWELQRAMELNHLWPPSVLQTCHPEDKMPFNSTPIPHLPYILLGPWEMTCCSSVVQPPLRRGLKGRAQHRSARLISCTWHVEGQDWCPLGPNMSVLIRSAVWLECDMMQKSRYYSRWSLLWSEALWSPPPQQRQLLRIGGLAQAARVLCTGIWDQITRQWGAILLFSAIIPSSETIRGVVAVLLWGLRYFWSSGHKTDLNTAFTLLIASGFILLLQNQV